ncbi:MAG TPA: helix-turn-helix transcriptional regulator [Anaerolineales bacterium]|nr:helix-turn-helix transcriptional regulator [Anaerolineales bacterium]
MLNTMPRTVRLTVAELLEKKGWSTAKFAEEAHLNYNQALNIRRGAYNRIDLDTIARICEALEIEPGELFIFENSETP